ncbi:MAG TPA: HAD family phosphatase [Candidatus Moranbacteria bacterium]|jgi:HAD superfamily phosphoserine phosphatase-like hydrolase|nr:HAD-IB family phosphatase [Candidatus Moranbacteria bacterium]HOF42241.1 HAD family phosphatase [Candidatus Moranbacteria bacterium]HPX94359.1 HAD family phosphatase [Candidatus Moranbacteria bacterium]HQB59488.1 HAD family phosphatase [Candidatus Moranbacteria bacterium]
MQKNKIAVFDIDGTIFRKNLQFELINELSWMNVFPRKVRNQIVSLYTDWIEHKGTYEQYRLGLVHLYEKCIKGCKLEDIERASKVVVSFHQDRTYIFAEQLIKKLRHDGYHLIAVSGSPIEIVKEYNRMHLRFNAVFGSVYECDDRGIYTGKTYYEPVRHKGSLVKQYVYEHNLTLEGSYGIGDTESDASFLEIVDNPTAFNPNDNLKKIAEKKGWHIVVEKKDVIYNIN